MQQGAPSGGPLVEFEGGSIGPNITMMNHSLSSTSRTTTTSPRATWGVQVGLIATMFLTACGSGPAGSTTAASHSPGELVLKPGGGFFYADANNMGNGSELRIARQAYGRLVEVFGLDATGLRVHVASDFVIAPELVSDGQDYVVEANPVTAQQVLVILRDVTDTSSGGGLQQFYDLLRSVGDNLIPIFDADTSGAGLYSMVPRNAAIVVQFDDVIDATTISETTVRVSVGSPPITPFESRMIPDAFHGELIPGSGGSGTVFRSSRLIIDSTVTEIESFQYDPPLAINGVGYPPSMDVNLANIEVRFPTVLNSSVGQTSLLTNPSGHPLASGNNGPVDWNSPTIDVIRAARSGGSGNVTGDAYNGFLLDQIPPQVVGTQALTIDSPPLYQGDETFFLPQITFDSVFCSTTPSQGDVLYQAGLYAEVVQPPSLVKDGVVTNVVVRVLLYPTNWDDAGSLGVEEWTQSGQGVAEFLSAFDPLTDVGQETCFVRILPTPSGYPSQPTLGVAPSSSFTLRFSEPMDPASVTAFDALTLTRQPMPAPGAPPLATSEFIVGSMGQTLDLQEFTFLPDLPLSHWTGTVSDYYLTLSPDVLGATDLSGNHPSSTLPSIKASTDPTAITSRTGGRVSRFTGLDEEAPLGTPQTGPIPEWTGQHLYDLQRQTIKPRPVVRNWGNADRAQPMIATMVPFSVGIQTPLSSLGSKLQQMWRYVDFSFGLADASNHNLDVEGLWWAPVGGAVVADTFANFEIQLGHSLYAPDEYIDPGSLWPKYPLSGLKPTFASNYLDKVNDPPTVVHDRFRGYSVNPGDIALHPNSGMKLMPYPWNRTVGPEDWTTYTWRDTTLRKRAGVKNGGVDPKQWWKAVGLLDPGCFYYKTNNVRTIGLALLMEFRCFPDQGAAGVNGLDISLAANSSAKPYFRAFSTGGIDTSNNPVQVDPDTENKANGGFNPTSSPPGKPTFGLDCSVYLGAADFVVRVSHSHSIWFPATNPQDGSFFNKPLYMQPIMEPRAEDQPVGTAITLAFRGMKKSTPGTAECGNGPEPWLENAITLDAYGDHYDDCPPPTCGILNHNASQENVGIKLFGDGAWVNDISLIDTAKYYQVRVSFQSDIFTGLGPELSALAVAWIVP